MPEIGCPSCEATVDVSPFLEQDSIPVHSCLMVDDRESAIGFPRGRMAACFCPECGFVWNSAFDPRRMRYSERYEETQGFSARFRRFQTELVERLVERHDLRGKRVLEIGCGKGEFLVELCEAAGCSGIGVDPAYRPERTASPAAGRIRFLRELFSEDHLRTPAELVACRHTLEHIHDPSRFLARIRRSLGERRDVVVFFEVPDVERVLREAAFWDLYYEHCSSFSAGSLARLFRRSGFEIVDLGRGFDDQYLLLEARPGSDAGLPHPEEETPEDLAVHVDSFRRTLPGRLESLRRELREGHRRARRTVLWGSGSKAVAYLNTLGLGAEIECVVDVNPHKHGRFLAGTGHEIVAPERLRTLSPELVIVMNPIYVEEIGADLARLGVQAEVRAL